MAKGSGGYFLLASANALYRLRRTLDPALQGELFSDPRRERHDLWTLPNPWQGTVVALEIRTDRIADFGGFFEWIRERMPARAPAARRIRFT